MMNNLLFLLTFLALIGISLSRQCNSQTTCASMGFPGYCCSIWNWCGTGSTYCGIGNCSSECSTIVPTSEIPISQINSTPQTKNSTLSELLSVIMYIDTWDGNVTSLIDSPTKIYIFSFLIVTSTNGGSFQLTIADGVYQLTSSIVDKLHNAGKVVLLSFGGASMDWNIYRNLALNVGSLVDQLVSIVTDLGVDGIDIDYEDTAGLMGTAGYNGIDFLVNLTNKLEEKLPKGSNIITHSPQGPYVDPSITGYLVNPPYKAIIQRTNITWLNVQFYNNPGFQETDYILNLYPKILGVNGYLSQEQIAFGKPVTTADCGSGWMETSNITQILSQLKKSYPNIRGAFGWQYSSDSGSQWQRELFNSLH
jgi:chitinase